ncbi:DinB family protein [Kineosporia sp. R_H_3]|uniref:DinB family protein n=1 Tax=Kineosporia sp. R_H_3 TaxID=1961848 RepID=UPI00117B9E69|nr:DinB family protein [Kineosporia sp. R_H_3]
MPQPMTVEQVLAQLRSTPARLRDLSRGVAPEVLRTAPAPDEWSANDVLAHLRACADRWGEAATRIVEEDEPRIRGTEPRVWITRTDYPDLQFAPSLRAFVRQRRALLAVLEPLSPEDWQRTGILVGAGRPVPRTVHTYAERLARHERPHVKQVERTLALLAR